jgi:signal transduction histidine kinase
MSGCPSSVRRFQDRLARTFIAGYNHERRAGFVARGMQHMFDAVVEEDRVARAQPQWRIDVCMQHRRSSFDADQQAKLERLARLASQVLRARAARAHAHQTAQARDAAETRLQSIFDEACETFLACDRLAVCVDQRLRAPLSRAQACLEKLHDLSASPEFRQLRSEATDEVAALRDLTDEMLAIARFDGHAANMKARTFEPCAVLHDVVTSLGDVAASRGVRLRVEDATDGYEVLGDPLRFDGLLEYLLSDVISQSQDVTLTIGGKFEVSFPNRPFLALTVRSELHWDTAELRWRLGAQCRAIIEAMAGAWVVSTEERCMTVWLPARLRAPVRRGVEAASNVISFSNS